MTISLLISTYDNGRAVGFWIIYFSKRLGDTVQGWSKLKDFEYLYRVRCLVFNWISFEKTRHMRVFSSNGAFILRSRR